MVQSNCSPEDLLEGRVWCDKSPDGAGGGSCGSTLRGPGEPSGETTNRTSYSAFKGGSQAKIWEKTSGSEARGRVERQLCLIIQGGQSTDRKQWEIKVMGGQLVGLG